MQRAGLGVGVEEFLGPGVVGEVARFGTDDVLVDAPCPALHVLRDARDVLQPRKQVGLVSMLRMP